MFDLFITAFGKQPPIRVYRDEYDRLYSSALTLGTLYLGEQGSGKTSALARHLIEYFHQYPNRGIFVLDWSGDLTNKIIYQICQLQFAERMRAAQRIIYDELGNEEWVLPLPELTDNTEEDVERVKGILNGLAHHPDEQAVILAGVAINKILPELMHVLALIKNQYGESWQITEAEWLLEHTQELKNILAEFADKLPRGTRDFLLHRIIEVDADEREMRTYKLTEMLGWMKSPYVRAALGYPRRFWSPDEVVRKGQLYIANGAKLINNPVALFYLLTQRWKLIQAMANRRVPANPKDEPFSVVLDETRNLFEIPAFAKDIGDIAPVYRSRKVQLYIVIQALSQLDPDLAEKIWLLGNMVIFGLENKKDCQIVAYQLARYDPHKEKQPARTRQQNPITEPEAGQDRLVADWINHLDQRQCIIKRHVDEQTKDHHIRYVRRTKDMPIGPLHISIEDFKNELLRDRGIPIPDALLVVDSRNWQIKPRKAKK